MSACGSSGGGDDGGEGGQGGGDEGGKGGSSKGGSGGSGKGGSGGSSAKGGSGGSSKGGSGGSSAKGGSGGGDSGGSGGTAAKGGSGGSSKGGAGGSAMAGSGGSAMAGSGGMTPPASAGVTLFSGKDMSVTKLNAGDDMPGYVYASNQGMSLTPELKPIDEASRGMLPADIKYAYEINAPTVQYGNVIFGWNWRKDVMAGTWNWFDASAYAGIKFWVKFDGAAAVCNIFNYDINNLTKTEQPGSMCEAEMREMCEPGGAASKIFRGSWEQFIIPWEGFAADGAIKGLDTKTLGRVDIIYLPFAAGNFRMWITGIGLATASEAL